MKGILKWSFAFFFGVLSTRGDALEGWRFPGDSSLNISSMTLRGVILYKNTTPFNDLEPRIIQITLVDEERGTAIFDVEYFLPSTFEGMNVWMDIVPSRYMRMQIPAMAGQHIARFDQAGNTAREDLWGSLFLRAGVGEGPRDTHYSCETPFRRVWMSRIAQERFLKDKPSMSLTRMDPLVVSWEQPFTLHGNFSNHGNSKWRRSVVVLGNGEHFRIKVQKWREDRIIVGAPRQCVIKPEYGGQPHHPPRIDPDLPYFVYVEWMGKSNLFLITFSPDGLPKWW